MAASNDLSDTAYTAIARKQTIKLITKKRFKPERREDKPEVDTPTTTKTVRGKDDNSKMVVSPRPTIETQANHTQKIDGAADGLVRKTSCFTIFIRRNRYCLRSNINGEQSKHSQSNK